MYDLFEIFFGLLFVTIVIGMVVYLLANAVGSPLAERIKKYLPFVGLAAGLLGAFFVLFRKNSKIQSRPPLPPIPIKKKPPAIAEERIKKTDEEIEEITEEIKAIDDEARSKPDGFDAELADDLFGSELARLQKKDEPVE